jgi:hypothetical protein
MSKTLVGGPASLTIGLATGATVVLTAVTQRDTVYDCMVGRARAAASPTRPRPRPCPRPRPRHTPGAPTPSLTVCSWYTSVPVHTRRIHRFPLQLDSVIVPVIPPEVTHPRCQGG